MATDKQIQTVEELRAASRSGSKVICPDRWGKGSMPASIVMAMSFPVVSQMLESGLFEVGS